MQLTEIGKTLRKKRESKGLSLMTVARTSGLCPGTISNVEEGKGITIRTLTALGRAYGLRLTLTMEDVAKKTQAPSKGLRRGFEGSRSL